MLEKLVRLPDICELEARRNGGFDRSTRQRVDDVAHQRAAAFAVMIVDVEREAAHRRTDIEMPAHRAEQIFVRQAREGVVGDQGAPAAENAKIVRELRAADVIEDQANALSIRQFARAGDDVFQSVIDDVISAVAPRKIGLLRRTDGSEHGPPL